MLCSTRQRVPFCSSLSSSHSTDSLRAKGTTWAKKNGSGSLFQLEVSLKLLEGTQLWLKHLSILLSELVRSQQAVVCSQCPDTRPVQTNVMKPISSQQGWSTAFHYIQQMSSHVGIITYFHCQLTQYRNGFRRKSARIQGRLVEDFRWEKCFLGLIRYY